MKKKNKPVDKPRASKDGNEYHEIWVARKSLELLNPNSKLKVLAVEGLSPVDQKDAKSEEVEIADVALYYGGKDFKSSEKVSILQFKYSVAYKNTPVKASDAKKTIEKFSETYKGHIKRFGQDAPKKLDFQFVTNRPISADFVKALRNLAAGVKNTGKYLAFENQFKTAANLKGPELKEFSSICEFLSYTKLLSTSKNELENTLISLSATSDSLASSRLGKLKDLVREKAGTSGDGSNTIERTDVFAALSVREIGDLLPCPEALSNWGETLIREQSNNAVNTISKNHKTTLIHAAGGVGKTVFMKSLATVFSENHEVVFFDSFGGGSYRSTEDARHLAKHGLIHIANTLAFRGLCDPILPNTPDDQALTKTFRHRLEQCLDTLKKTNSKRQIYIFIDAIDNAEFAAKQNGELAFSKILLESFHDRPINGVKLIVSCRTERKPTTYAKYDDFELKAFSKNEAKAFLESRIENPPSVFIDSAYSRSGGNARVLDYLIESKSQDIKTKSKLELDDLLTQKIGKAIETATQRGSSQDDLTTFLSGLTLLAPPISIEDYALANKVDSNAITSMISDLAPLLELSKYGVMFKDEPTETLIIKKYGSKIDDLKKIASSLSAIQDQSIFAAKTLPDLLYKLGDGDGIYSLANDSRIPSSIESDMGKLKIKYARLKVAAKYAAEKKDFDKLIGFLIEISSLAEFDQRGLGYLLKSPELVVELGDSDAIRRIYEARTEWPGTRHARLGIIHTLRGELEEAHEHIYFLSEWVNHYLRMDQKSRFEFKASMGASDCVAEPLFFLAKKSSKIAARYFSRWRDWYSFEVATQLYRYLPLAIEKGIVSKEDISVFYGELENVGALLATLVLYELPQKDKIYLLKKLAKHLEDGNIEFPDTLSSKRDFLFQKCFLYSSLSSFKGNDKKTSETILNALGSKRPRVYAFKDHYYHNSFPVEFLLREVIKSIITGKDISFLDILPDELYGFGKTIESKESKDFLKDLKSRVEDYLKSSKDDDNKIIRDSDKGEIEDFLSRRLPQLHTLAVSIRNLLNSADENVKQRFDNLIETWERISKNQTGYRLNQIDHLWLQFGAELIIFSLFTLKNVNAKDIERLQSSPNLQNVGVNSKAEMIQAFSVLFPNDEVTGKAANELAKHIQLENDVTTRAAYYADIARSLLLVSKEEAVEYFKKGLLSVDAIGSGDYRYVNELLIFAASLHGKELEPSEYHSLNNVCELNMNEEPHKFYWEPYSAAFSKVAGIRGLAQLSRWDDRQKISLSYTLLPSLISLVRDKKLSPKDAIALNYLSSPAEYRTAGTTEFIDALSSVEITAQEIKELVHQFTLNNSGVPMSSTVKALGQLSEKILGKEAPETLELNKSFPAYRELIDKSNRHSNLNSSLESDKFRVQQEKKKKGNEKLLLKKIDSIKPANKESFKSSLKILNHSEYSYDLKDIYFSSLRQKLPYKNRKDYVENLASIEDGEFHWYWILEELNKCHEVWGSSSISLKESFKKAGLALLHQHSVNLIGSDYLSRSDLDRISQFSGIAISDLALELIKIGSQHNVVVSGAVWLSLATLLNEKSSDGAGQSALKKLLVSESVTLGELASDGMYKAKLYPENNAIKVIAGLTWKVLGSFDAKERWRAAHSIRCFAQFDRWDVISELVGMISRRDAGAFQCLDIKFYDYHARLWLLISLARLAKDYPAKVAAYKPQIDPFTKEDHVLFRHFAAMALLECHKASNSLLTVSELKRLTEVNQTKKPLIDESRKRLNSYQGRPRTEAEATRKFYLEYEFRKMNVDTLGNVFNIDCWKVDDLIAESAYEIDPGISGHTDTGNKSLYRRYDRSAPNEQMYGDQVAWHALLITAGKLLSDHSVTKNSWRENSWNDWLSRYVLTREDDFWQSDTLDIIPLEIKNLLREEKQGKLFLTEDRDILLGLANLNNKTEKNIVIDGHWNSEDGISVVISSALVPKKLSQKAVIALSKENPFHVWVPDLDGEEENRFGTQNDHNLIPWIVSTESYRKLDEFDPYGANISRDRSRIIKKIIEAYKLNSTDQFERYWNDENGEIVLKSEIWRGPKRDRRDEEYSGLRLTSSTKFLKRILRDGNVNLILLIRLQQYVESVGSSSSDFFHSIAIVEINEKLEIKYRKGCNKDISQRGGDD